MSKSVFLTGASGFVGGATLCRLVAENYTVIAALRDGANLPKHQIATVKIDSIDGATTWQGSLAGVDTVIHSAARVHVMNDTETDPLAAFRRVNVEGTLNLARHAVAAGVRRFILSVQSRLTAKVFREVLPIHRGTLPRPWILTGSPRWRPSNSFVILRLRREWRL